MKLYCPTRVYVQRERGVLQHYSHVAKETCLLLPQSAHCQVSESWVPSPSETHPQSPQSCTALQHSPASRTLPHDSPCPCRHHLLTHTHTHTLDNSRTFTSCAPGQACCQTSSALLPCAPSPPLVPACQAYSISPTLQLKLSHFLEFTRLWYSENTAGGQLPVLFTIRETYIAWGQ